MTFPKTRLRRLRSHPKLRELVSETRLSEKDLVAPLFVDATISSPKNIESLPGVQRFPVGSVTKQAMKLADLGIPAVLLFGVPESKDDTGSGAFSKDGVVQRAVSSIKEATDIAVITDLCLCEYTTHGHCGVLAGRRISNDKTLEVYRKIAVSQADAGADMIAPSGMMDGQVGAIRAALDEEGFDNIPILAYSTKFASSLYGPFREAADSRPSFGDRRTHQMDARNVEEARREVKLDLEEGADVLMVKPALPYLDILAMLRREINVPLAAYQVSGEYSMIKASAERGWLDESKFVEESLTAIKRAGAAFMVTYFAEQFAQSRQR